MGRLWMRRARWPLRMTSLERQCGQTLEKRLGAASSMLLDFDRGGFQNKPNQREVSIAGAGPMRILVQLEEHTGGTLIAGLSKNVDAYTQHSDTLKAAINSFHALSPAERVAARPHRIRVVTAQPGTTMARLAAQSPLGVNAVAQLRLLNNLYPDGEPQPRQLLKVIQ